MTDPVAEAARSAAERLAPSGDPRLAVEVEAALAARDGEQRPGQYDPTAIAGVVIGAGSLIVSVAQLAALIPQYTDEIKNDAANVGNTLKGLGVKQGDLVTLGLPNSTGFVEACYGIWKLGATPQPISFRLPKVELEAIMELAKTPVVIADFQHRVDRPILSVADLLARSDDESDLRLARGGRVNVANPRTPGGRIARSMDIDRNFMFRPGALEERTNRAAAARNA